LRSEVDKRGGGGSSQPRESRIKVGVRRKETTEILEENSVIVGLQSGEIKRRVAKKKSKEDRKMGSS